MKDMKDIAEDLVQIDESVKYDIIIEKLKQAKDENIPINEGIFGAIGGAVLGTAFGPKLGQAICKALGIDQKGMLGNLITSRLVIGSICTSMGWKI